MICQVCDGGGGSKDYFGEWSECDVCSETGTIEPAELACFYANLTAGDWEIDAMMLSEPCDICDEARALCDCGATWATVQ